MTDFRKAGAQILRIIQSAADPALEAGRVLLYGKDSGGTTKLFMRDSAGTVTEVGAGGGGGSPSLSTPVGTNTDFNTTQTVVNGNLSSLATQEWMVIGDNSGSSYDNRGVNGSGSVGSFHTRRKSSRLWKSFFWYGPFTINALAAGAISITSTAADDFAGSALNQTAWRHEIAGAGSYGFGFDVPMMANETGTVTIACAHASIGMQIDASFGDGSVSPVSLIIPNFSPGAGTRSVSMITIPFTNGSNGGNRLRVTAGTGGSSGPFTAHLWPLYIYW